MRRKRATKFVTSDEMTLCEFYGAILLFRNENQYSFEFNQNYSDFFLICNKQLITWDFGRHPKYQPSTIISPRANALGPNNGVLG